MSADNGTILRRNTNGQFVLHGYFVSDEKYPDVDDDAGMTFNTLEEALGWYENFQKTAAYPDEYGLSVHLTNINVNNTTVEDALGEAYVILREKGITSNLCWEIVAEMQKSGLLPKEKNSSERV